MDSRGQLPAGVATSTSLQVSHGDCLIDDWRFKRFLGSKVKKNFEYFFFIQIVEFLVDDDTSVFCGRKPELTNFFLGEKKNGATGCSVNQVVVNVDPAQQGQRSSWSPGSALGWPWPGICTAVTTFFRTPFAWAVHCGGRSRPRQPSRQGLTRLVETFQQLKNRCWTCNFLSWIS